MRAAMGKCNCDCEAGWICRIGIWGSVALSGGGRIGIRGADVEMMTGLDGLVGCSWGILDRWGGWGLEDGMMEV
jgi:hypothetical protein